MTGQSDKAHEAMGAMEQTIGGLQDELIVAKEPPRNRFKPTGMILMVLVALVVGGGLFFGVSALRETPHDAKTAIDENCEIRNDKLDALNQKFAELSLLFDLALLNRPPGTPPPAAVVVEALERFKKPIALVDCGAITKEIGLRP